MKLSGLSVIALIVAAASVVSLSAQDEKAAVAALQKANVLQRLAKLTAPHASKTGTAPSFVVDPAWPQTLPNNWIIGDIGGLFVDKHDHIWVYHRPRSLAATDAGALPPAGKNAKGKEISAMGHGRPFNDKRSGCCIPAPDRKSTRLNSSH